MNVSERLANFVSGFKDSTLNEQARHTARRALLDTIAGAIAGSREPASILVSDYARDQVGPLMGTVWATGERLPIEVAALVNGVMGHVLDYDDVTSPMRGHPSIALLPALTALAEAEGLLMGQLLTAYTVGFEVICKMSRAIAGEHYAKGWHTTSSIGILGTTAACAHLAGLSKEQVVDAVGLAVAQTSGTRENFGTMAKSFQAGHAGAVALRSVLLARLGFTASADAVDGKQGYLTLYADGQSVETEVAGLGCLPLEIERSGIEVKKYPLCYATHRAIDGIIDLRREVPTLAISDVESVDVIGSNRSFVPLIHDRPQTGLEAKFSMQYAVAAALMDGFVRLSSFTNEAVQRPDIQALLPKIRPREAEGTLLPRWTELQIHLTNGKTLHKKVESLRGSAELPLTDDELLEKVWDCCSYSGLPVDHREFAAILTAKDREPVADVVRRLVSNVSNAAPVLDEAAS